MYVFVRRKYLCGLEYAEMAFLSARFFITLNFDVYFNAIKKHICFTYIPID